MARKWFTFSAQDTYDAETFFSRTESAYINHGGLKLITSTPQLLSQSFDLPYGFGLIAPAITITNVIRSEGDIYLETTAGDLCENGALAARSVYLISKGGLHTYNIGSAQDIIMHAEKGHVNSGNLQAFHGTIQSQASYISNSLEESSIEGNMIFLKALQEDILNYGIINGFTYLEASAKRDILNLSMPHHGGIPYFHRARMQGGTGIAYIDGKGEERYLGLYLKAENRIHNYVSDICAQSDVFLSGRRGILHNGDTMTYIAAQYTTKSGWFGWRKENHTIWKTIVGQSLLQSTQGKILQEVLEGELTYKGTHVSAPEGDYACVRDQIRYEPLIIQDRHEVRGSSWWGLSRFSGYESHQGAVPTQLINGDLINHRSLFKGISGRGVLIQAPIYQAQAKEKIVFEGVKLHHHYHHENQSLLPFFFGSEVMASLFTGDLTSGDLLKLDPLLNQLKDLTESSTSSQTVSAGLKSVRQFYNDMQSLKEAITQGQETQWFFERYGNIGLRAEQTTFDHNYTTTFPALLHVGILDLKSDQGVEFNEGAQAHIESLFRIRAPYLRLKHAVNESQTNLEHHSLEMGVNFFTNLPFASYQASSSSTYSKTHQYALINVWGQEGHVDLGELDLLDLDGGMIFANRISGTIYKALLTSYQDETTSQHHSFGLSFSKGNTNWRGSINFSQQGAFAKWVNQHSGIMITENLGQNFKINNLVVTDTELNTPLQESADHVFYHPLVNENENSGFALTVNLDLSSPQTLGKELAKSLAIGTAGFAVAECATHLGAEDGLASFLGSSASLATGIAIDNSCSSKTETTNTHSDIQSRGSFYYNVNGREICLDFFDMPSAQKLEEKRKEILQQILEIEENLTQSSSQQFLDSIKESLTEKGASAEEIQLIFSDPVMLEGLLKQDSYIITEALPPENFTNDLEEQFYLQGREDIVKQMILTTLHRIQEGAIALDDFSNRHPALTNWGFEALQFACGGPARYVKDKVFAEIGLTDLADAMAERGKEYLRDALVHRFGLTTSSAEISAEVGHFGLMVAVSTFVDIKTDKILKSAKKVSEKVKPLGSMVDKASVAGKKVDAAGQKVEKSKTKKTAKDDQWTVRPGQEWKEKIKGKGQKTGTPGHATASYREAIEVAKRKDVTEVNIDLGVNRLLPDGSKMKPNTRPDVTYKTKDGKIHQIEVPSKTDTNKKLMARMEDTNSRLPDRIQGEFYVKPIKVKKAAETVKKITDGK
jgi:hypothetical protein